MIRFSSIKKEAFKLFAFAATGFFSAAIDCSVYYLLLNFSTINFVLIQPISMSVGLCCSFLLNRCFVFKQQKQSFSYEVVKYLIVCALSISISPLIISFYHIWFSEYIVKIPATLTTGILNYCLNRFFVYKKLSDSFKFMIRGDDDEIL